MVGVPLAFAVPVNAAEEELCDRICFNMNPDYSLRPLRFHGEIGKSTTWAQEITFFIRERIPYGVSVIAVEDRGDKSGKFNQGLGEALLVVEKQRLYLDEWVKIGGVEYSKNVLFVLISAKKWYGGDGLQPDLENVHECYYDSLPGYTKGVKFQAFIHAFA